MSIIKRNKLPLFLLAVVMMLSVFYVFNPVEEDITTSGDNINTEETFAVFAEERLNILEERNLEILSKETLIAEGELSTIEVSNLIEEINEICSILDLEVSLEQEIMGIGYEYVLVEVTDEAIIVSIYAEDISKEEFISVVQTISEVLEYDESVQIKSVY